jgi:hypothetical protein
LNLRKGGTTHPFLTLQFLTDGSYDGARGVFLTPSGSTKYLVATDHLEDERLKALTVTDIFDIVVEHGLHFDQARRTGVVFHMLSCLTECGRVGLTAVGDDPEDARRIYDEAQSVLLREADEALEEGAVIRISATSADQFPLRLTPWSNCCVLRCASNFADTVLWFRWTFYALGVAHAGFVTALVHDGRRARRSRRDRDGADQPDRAVGVGE